ncbi:MAG: CPBP family intramembrane metalloprotease [Chloroflexi bacterium]|nr:MAG: CPBP family intramembrane metalloprotease [Chloroflexota bacterium]
MQFSTFAGQLSEWLGAIAASWLFSLSPRLQKPEIGFKYARRDGITALMLSALLLALSYVLYTITPFALPQIALPANVQNSGSLEIPHPAPGPNLNLMQALLAAVLALATIGIALAVRKQPVKSAGWPRDLFMPALQMGFALAILTIFLRNRVMDVLTGLNPAELNILLLALGISLAEETVFRGYIQLRLSWWFRALWGPPGQWAGIGLTALIFTLWHVPAWLNQEPVETSLALGGLTFVQGLVLGWIASKSKHVIAPALYRSASIWMNFLG